MPRADIRLKLELRGISEFANNIAKYGQKTKQAAGDALVDEAREIMSRSIPQVPTETGTLQQANFIDGPFVDAEEVRVRLGYGGPADKRNPKTGQMASEYAVVVHERLGAKHPSGNAKFLETPVMEASRSMESRVGFKIQRSL